MAFGSGKGFFKGIICPAVNITLHQHVGVNTDRIKSVIGYDGIGAVMTLPINRE